MKKRTGYKITLLLVGLAVAAVLSVLLLDVWGWMHEEDRAAESEAFPGVEAPSFLPPPEPISPGPFNVLILGLDHGMGRPTEGNERSDVILVAHIDEARGRACLLSLPRDSYVEIPGYRRSKINEAYQLGGPETAMRTVEQVTGMKISYYVVMDFDEFKWLVDLFGGVQVTMDKPLSDPKLGIIPAGSQVLDGEHALILARSRNYGQGDLERGRQQQRLLVQILYKGKEMANSPGAAWFLSIALDPLETNLTPDEVIRLAREFGSFPAVDVQGGVAPGSPGMVGSASVYLLDAGGLRELVNSIETQCFVPVEFR